MKQRITRRELMKTSAMAGAALVAAPYVRGAYAAGKLSIGFWDHWVPGANKATQAAVTAWAEKEKVEVQIDYIPSQGSKNLITIAAESQAKSGHDIFAFPAWYIQAYQEQLVDVTDVMDPLIKQNGAVNDTVTYLSKIKGKWMAVPATVGSQIKGPCSRIDLMKKHAGIDVQARRRRPRTGPTTATSRRLRHASRAAIRSALASARRRTPSTPRARSSTASVLIWSMPAARSRSSRMQFVRRLNTA
jgi:ABC-type glycerol-3-phosphate transport system substrate-binding protein